MLYSKAEGEGTVRSMEAKQHLRRALTLNPRLGQAHVQLGVILQAEGNLSEAVASYQRGVALAPGYAAARYRLASAYQRLGNRSRAQIELDAFRKLKEKEKEEETQALLRGVSAPK
jgi:Flp pilus assembly protein TadD